MKSKILKGILENVTPEITARVNQISNEIIIEKLRKENEEMKAMLNEIYNDVEAFSDLSSYGYGSKIEELLNKVKPLEKCTYCENYGNQDCDNCDYGRSKILNKIK